MNASAGPALPVYGVAILAVFLSSSIDTIVKYAGPEAGLHILLAWRFFFGAIIAIFVYRLRSHQAIGAASVRFHAARGLIQLLSISLYFYSITQLSLAVATILSFTSVLFVLPVAAILLGEKVSAFATLAAAVGFLGVAITVLDITAPGHSVELTGPAGVAAGLASGFLTAFLLVFLRLRSASEDPHVISLFTNLVPAIVLLPVLTGMFGAPSLMEIFVFFILGLLGYSVWFLLAVAYARAPAQALAPTEYLSVAIAALYGYAFFGEGIELRMIAGSAVIICACLLVTRARLK
ncbi:DMT family transporter [Hyphococcus sp.]|uniref:DMT family transporter n=1 Tax=Hyphococcus sp. TaxID=2038636 RepID=UPI00208A617C|nr:MAG: hypothetical protein DHS20C04_29160 [Marinicaulis sp.]